MKVARTLSLYVTREVVLYMLVGLAGVSLAFMGQNLLRYLSEFLRIGVDLSDVLMVLRAVFIVIMAYTIPIGFLFGVLAGVGRMANDSEILALRANGVGIGTVIGPVLVLAVAVSALTAWLAIDVEHRTKRELRDLIVSMTKSGRMIQPQRFTHIEDRMIYVDSRSRDDRLEGVFISDRSSEERPMLIFAEYGDFSFDPDEGEVVLELRNGSIHMEPKDESPDQPGRYQRISFQAFDYAFTVESQLRSGFGRIRPKDMTNEELRRIIARGKAGKETSRIRNFGLAEFEAQLYRRYALPLAPIVFALLAVPLSLRQVRGVRSRGVLVCGLLCVGYYCIFTFFQYLAVEGVLPVLVALWLPNVVLGGLGVALVMRVSRISG
jgi:lipopolysaccharide export system permease protein